jgi:hypothetical protein
MPAIASFFTGDTFISFLVSKSLVQHFSKGEVIAVRICNHQRLHLCARRSVVRVNAKLLYVSATMPLFCGPSISWSAFGCPLRRSFSSELHFA